MEIKNLLIKTREGQMVKLNEVYSIEIGKKTYGPLLKSDPFDKDETNDEIIVFSKYGCIHFDLEDALSIEFKLVRDDLSTIVLSHLEEEEGGTPKYEKSKNNSRQR